ncbi:MAG: ketoacyl-ACP synthase III, partial [FCB group bacterium]
MNYYIKNIEYYLPDKIIDNDFLENECGIDKKFTEDKVGIIERRIAGVDETTSMLAYNAAKKLIETENLTPDSIDLLLVCTQNPDYVLPTTACLVQDMLKLKKSCMAFDINLGCSGFVYALPIAGNFIKNGTMKNAMIIMADEYSKVIDYKDRNTASIFGDAGSASLLTACEDGFGVLDVNFGTDGSGASQLIVYNSGVAKNKEKSDFLFMDGREIFKFSMLTIPASVRELLNRNNIEQKDIKYFIFHQANKYMLQEMQKRMKIPDEQMVIDMKYIGNTVSSTIPIALKNIFNKN